MSYVNKTKQLSGLFDIMMRNISLNRRQMCKIAAMAGVAFSAVLPFRTDNASAKGKKPFGKKETVMNLDPPAQDGTVSLERAIKQRRTVRSFGNMPISKRQFSQILWSAQGITEDGGFKRASPSGGALYPADIYAVVGNNCIEDLVAGVYYYQPMNHSVTKIAEGDRRNDLAIASLSQMWMAGAPLLFVITAEYRRITCKYGDRGIRYALMEIGHISQNIFLQCQTLGLSAGIVGAFDDGKVARSVGAYKNHEPLIILPVGYREQT
jgi:SagB-type dehydrogenase family enzyme